MENDHNDSIHIDVAERLADVGQMEGLDDRIGLGVDPETELRVVLSTQEELAAQRIAVAEDLADLGLDRDDELDLIAFVDEPESSRTAFNLLAAARMRERLLRTEFESWPYQSDEGRAHLDLAALGVELALRDHNDVLRPAFQAAFSEVEREQFAAMNSVLNRHLGSWSLWAWWVETREELDGQAPWEVVADEVWSESVRRLVLQTVGNPDELR